MLTPTLTPPSDELIPSDSLNLRDVGASFREGLGKFREGLGEFREGLGQRREWLHAPLQAEPGDA